MKILHLLDSVNRGGAEMQALDVCRSAKNFGFEMTFVATGGGNMEEDFRNSGVEFIRLHRRLPIDFQTIRQLRKIIKERKIEIVHAYQAVEGIHLYFATVGMKDVKRVLSFQGGIVPDWKNKKALDFLIPKMNANVVVSHGLKNWHRDIDKLDTNKNFHVIFNGADRKRILSDRKVLRKEFNLNEKDLLIGMIANFYREKRKDQMTVCRALPKIFSEVENARLVFVGRTETGAEKKFDDCVNFCRDNGIAERVNFIGGRNDIPDVLASLDLFVFSSYHEGLPVAVTEAMLAGVPTILSDIEPLLEVSNNGEFAEIFKVENADELAEKAIKLLKDENLRKSSAEKTLTWATANFSIESHLKKLKELYQTL